MAKPVTKESSQPEVENQPVVQPVAQETPAVAAPKRKKEEDSAKSTVAKKKTKALKAPKVSLVTVSLISIFNH